MIDLQLTLIDRTEEYDVYYDSYKEVYDDEGNITTQEYSCTELQLGIQLQEYIQAAIRRHMKNDLCSITIKPSSIMLVSYYTSELTITECIHFDSLYLEPEYTER